MTENVFQRTGGPYLDIEERKARELKSARIEGREPNFSASNLFPEVDHTVNIAVDPTSEESVDSALGRLTELSSDVADVSVSSAEEAPVSSPVLAAEASSDVPTPNGQVKTEEGTPDNDAVNEEVNSSVDSDPANNSENLTPAPVAETEVTEPEGSVESVEPEVAETPEEDNFFNAPE